MDSTDRGLPVHTLELVDEATQLGVVPRLGEQVLETLQCVLCVGVVIETLLARPQTDEGEYQRGQRNGGDEACQVSEQSADDRTRDRAEQTRTDDQRRCQECEQDHRDRHGEDGERSGEQDRDEDNGGDGRTCADDVRGGVDEQTRGDGHEEHDGSDDQRDGDGDEEHQAHGQQPRTEQDGRQNDQCQCRRGESADGGTENGTCQTGQERNAEQGSQTGGDRQREVLGEHGQDEGTHDETQVACGHRPGDDFENLGGSVGVEEQCGTARGNESGGDRTEGVDDRRVHPRRESLNFLRYGGTRRRAVGRHCRDHRGRVGGAGQCSVQKSAEVSEVTECGGVSGGCTAEGTEVEVTESTGNVTGRNLVDKVGDLGVRGGGVDVLDGDVRLHLGSHCRLHDGRGVIGTVLAEEVVREGETLDRNRLRKRRRRGKYPIGDGLHGVSRRGERGHVENGCGVCGGRCENGQGRNRYACSGRNAVTDLHWAGSLKGRNFFKTPSF